MRVVSQAKSNAPPCSAKYALKVRFYRNRTPSGQFDRLQRCLAIATRNGKGKPQTQFSVGGPMSPPCANSPCGANLSANWACREFQLMQDGDGGGNRLDGEKGATKICMTHKQVVNPMGPACLGCGQLCGLSPPAPARSRFCP